MNIYDFDNTIYDGDSCKDIVLFGLKKYPINTIKSLIEARRLNKEYRKKSIKFEKVKEALLSFIFKIDNYKEFVNEFVDSHMHKIKTWYIKRKNDNDVLVSASYDLWIKEFAKRLNIKYVIATKVNSKGKIIGKNCKKEEKVKRIKKLFKNKKIINSYSDSESDKPILELASNPYVVEGNIIKRYRKNYLFKNKR